MPHLYPHKRAGWQILYKIYFPDGTQVKKGKCASKKNDALLKFSDVKELEALTRKRAITRDENVGARRCLALSSGR